MHDHNSKYAELQENHMADDVEADMGNAFLGVIYGHTMASLIA